MGENEQLAGNAVSSVQCLVEVSCRSSICTAETAVHMSKL